MLKFYIEGNNPLKNLPFRVEAVHSDALKNRKGYNSNFLGRKVPLPSLAVSLQKDVAILQKNIGENGDRVLDYTHFSVVLSKSKKLPFYTAVNIDGITNLLSTAHEPRGSNYWLADARVFQGANKYQYGTKDYEKSGFQKGHMVRYFDPAWGSSPATIKQAVGDTFHYSNCCPQIPYYNSVVWNYLEDYYMARAIFPDKKITVFSGPIFNKARIINGLLVPVNFWKVIVYKSADGIAAMGLIMSHEKYFDRLVVKKQLSDGVVPARILTKDSIEKLYRKQELIDAKVRISLIEEKTKISFGLNRFDEKKNDERLDIELINPPQAKRSMIRRSPQHSAADLSAFFDAM